MRDCLHGSCSLHRLVATPRKGEGALCKTRTQADCVLQPGKGRISKPAIQPPRQYPICTKIICVEVQLRLETCPSNPNVLGQPEVELIQAVAAGCTGLDERHRPRPRAARQGAPQRRSDLGKGRGVTRRDLGPGQALERRADLESQGSGETPRSFILRLIWWRHAAVAQPRG